MAISKRIRAATVGAGVALCAALSFTLTPAGAAVGAAETNLPKDAEDLIQSLSAYGPWVVDFAYEAIGCAQGPGYCDEVEKDAIVNATMVKMDGLNQATWTAIRNTLGDVYDILWPELGKEYVFAELPADFPKVAEYPSDDESDSTPDVDAVGTDEGDGGDHGDLDAVVTDDGAADGGATENDPTDDDATNEDAVDDGAGAVDAAADPGQDA